MPPQDSPHIPINLPPFHRRTEQSKISRDSMESSEEDQPNYFEASDGSPTGLRDCYLARTVEDGSCPANEAHARKERLVGAACRNFGLTFVPVAMCALGSMTQTTYNLISKISTDKAIRSGADISKTVNNSFKKMNCLLMKCNANLLLNRCPVIRDIEPDIESEDSNSN